MRARFQIRHRHKAPRDEQIEKHRAMLLQHVEKLAALMAGVDDA